MSSIIHVFDRNTPETTTVVGSPNSLLFTPIFPFRKLPAYHICHTIIHSSLSRWNVRFNSEVLGLLSDNIFLRTYLPGQCIFNDGDVGEFIYILMRGRVEVKSQGPRLGGICFVWIFRLGKKEVGLEPIEMKLFLHLQYLRAFSNPYCFHLCIVMVCNVT